MRSIYSCALLISVHNTNPSPFSARTHTRPWVSLTGASGGKHPTGWTDCQPLQVGHSWICGSKIPRDHKLKGQLKVSVFTNLYKRNVRTNLILLPLLPSSSCQTGGTSSCIQKENRRSQMDNHRCIPCNLLIHLWDQVHTQSPLHQTYQLQHQPKNEALAFGYVESPTFGYHVPRDVRYERKFWGSFRGFNVLLGSKFGFKRQNQTIIV